MLASEAPDFVTGARKASVLITSCKFPHSLFQLYVGNLHRKTPDLLFYISGHYKYKSIYVKCKYKGSPIIIQGR